MKTKKQKNRNNKMGKLKKLKKIKCIDIIHVNPKIENQNSVWYNVFCGKHSTERNFGFL